MITGDGDFSLLTADNVELWEGLGLFDGVIVDQHFVRRRRHNRLRRLPPRRVRARSRPLRA